MSVFSSGSACRLGVLLYLLLAASGCDQGDAPVSPGKPTGKRIELANGAAIEWRNCPPARAEDFVHQCGTFFTTPRTGNFELDFIVLRKHRPSTAGKPSVPSEDPADHPLVYINGGPGGGGALHPDTLAYWQTLTSDMSLQRDLVLFNSRGTPGSRPRSGCEPLTEQLQRLAETAHSRPSEYQTIYDMVHPCLEQFDARLRQPDVRPAEGEGGLSLLSSVYQAQDVNTLMSALGYSRWHLWGASYGARVALLAGDNPNVVSLVLDSPFTLELGALADNPRLTSLSLRSHRTLFNHYHPDAGVEFNQLFGEAIEKLNQNPVRVNPDIRIAGEPAGTIVINGNRFKDMAFAVLYDATLWQPFYTLLLDIHNPDIAVTENHFELKMLAGNYLYMLLDPTFDIVTFMAVSCVDLPKTAGRDVAEALVAYPDIFDYAAGMAEFDVCQQKVFADARRPLTDPGVPAKPMLVAAGRFDPVTPAANARELMRDPAIHKYVEAPMLGHGVLSSFGCAPSILPDFLEAAERQNLQSLSFSCAEGVAGGH